MRRYVRYCECVCNAKSGTDLAKSGTAIAYAVRCPVNVFAPADGSVTQHLVKVALPPRHPKSNTRNRIPGTNCTEIAVSCIGFRGVSWTSLYPPTRVLREARYCAEGNVVQSWGNVVMSSGNVRAELGSRGNRRGT
eukprot:895665-Rhodomonas_salina.1